MVKYHPELIQGSDEWFAARLGLLTASEMKLIITPSNLKPAANDKERAHVYELAAQRITKYVEPHYIGDDMLRGHEDEVEARILYDKHYAPVTDVGFVTNDKWGFTIGYSPDGLVGEDGQIECKSRRQRFQVEVILSGKIPEEHLIQGQTALMVTERKWLDYISYCGGMPMFVARVYPDEAVQGAILTAATIFYEKMEKKITDYNAILTGGMKLIPTERKKYEEITV